MQVMVMQWDGPRSRAAVEASARAGRDRIEPLVESRPELRSRLLGGFRAVGPDGAEVVVEVGLDDTALDDLHRLVMGSELLPGEDPALLTGPDRIGRYTSCEAFGPLASFLSPQPR